MAAVPVVRFPILSAVRVIGVIVATLVLTWNVHFRGGLALISDDKSASSINGDWVDTAQWRSIIGVWAALKFHNDKGIDNFYSLHSWLGLACLFLFTLQWAAGFVTYWFPGGSKHSRANLLPWHVFFGVYTYALAVVTVTTGILEKVTFLQTHQVISRYSTEALLVNSLGILVIVLGGFVILAVITPMNDNRGDVLRGPIE
ncbi:hypothetical protein DVH24_028379 [Malus domestica]|uniref:ascorbate ferrireductase (transmembrane) n=1 Tax=Malus domestica TaxID=3750 RepID=A0A498HED1_MALDO|nr:hypothetical protein DVH24_028379 [Malus domestica]